MRSCALISSHIAFLHLGSFNASATDVGILSVAGTTTAERLSLATGLRFRVDALCGWCWTGFGAAGGASVEGMIVGCVDCSGGGIGGAAAAVEVVVVGASLEAVRLAPEKWMEKPELLMEEPEQLMEEPGALEE